MRIYLGSDHAGFELKADFVERLTELGHDPVDCGALTYDAADDYPPPCFAAATRAVADPNSLGIVIGGSGNGEQIAANKVPGVRCALVWSVQTAQLGRQHNNANVMGIGARMHSREDALTFMEAFIDTAFSHDPRHERRIGLLTAYEDEHKLPN